MRRQIPIAGCFAMVLVAAGGELLSAAEPGSTKTDYPNRAITIIVPYAAGGPSDTLSRIVASHMSRTLGQKILVENIVGAGGTTASLRARRS
ncbi:MAG TPA: tripartite tricarboxylate transporter substrate binding protein BugD, partial [Burkholderiales bacterium]|nr:tripartite tricarboxylate transporter substrate binding protein BugD [Burkholderiales bacterium]